MLEGREAIDDRHSGGLGQFHGRLHITIGRNDNGHITAFLKSIPYNLRGDTDIALFLFISSYLVPTILARQRRLQILTQDQLKLWVLFICLKQQGLSLGLIFVADGLGGKVFDSDQFLMRLHKGLKQMHKINPIIAFPTRVAFQSVVEIETVNIYYDSLFYHILKNKPTLPLAGSLSANLLEGDSVAKIRKIFEIITKILFYIVIVLITNIIKFKIEVTMVVIVVVWVEVLMVVLMEFEVM